MAIVAWAASGEGALAQRSLGDLTGPWQLFVDDHHVDSKSNLERVYHPFEKYAGNPVLTPTKSWEDSIVYIYGSVLPAETGGGYRMWYHTMRPEDPADDGSNILYATSPDGITWNKPNLYINTWHGSAANNMVFNRATVSGLTSVMHTPFDPDPARRYKLFNYEPGVYYGAYSADGVQTVDVPNNPLITGVGDVGMASWDPHTQRYLAYVKINTDVNGLRRRSVALCTSTDFVTWTAPQLVLEPDTFDDRWVPAGTVQRTHFYGLCAFAYESMYVGILWIFRATEPEGYTIGPVYAEIVTSHDGVNWTRQEGNRPAMLPLGSAGAWDDGQLYTAIAPVYMNGKLAIYYGACDDVHGTATKRLNCSIGLATLRRDGFASLDAGATVGTVTTKELFGLSGQLHVNYRSNGGAVRVEVLDSGGNVVAGYSAADCVPLQGDSIDETVAWTNHAELPTGISPLRLRFVLQNASIYSFKSAALVYEPPTITAQPGHRTISAGATATFTVQAQGSSPLSYRWQRNGIDLTEAGEYTGVNAPTLTVSATALANVGEYACTVSNPYGRTTSSPANLALSSLEFAGLGAGTVVTGMTADGTVACGTLNANRAFIWTASGGLKDLGVPNGATSSAAAGVGIWNGNVVVAVNTNAASSRAHRWEGNTAGAGTFTALPRLNSTLEWNATGLGSSGTDYWISGFAPSGGDAGGRKAGRYARNANTTVSFTLPNLGHDNSDFHAVADNGWCGGQYQYKGTAPGGGARNAMYYAGGSQCAPLDTLLGAPSTTYEAVVKAISRNGAVRGGWSYYPGGGSYSQPVVWRAGTAPTSVPFISGGDADNAGEILALNADGSLAGGYSYRRGTTNGPYEALVWDPVRGTRRYESMLTDSGLDLTGWLLQDVRAMSGDGNTLAGNGSRSGQAEAWIVIAAVQTPATITASPENQRACAGESAVFAVAHDGVGPFLYEWQHDGAVLSDGPDHTGTAGPVLTVLDVGESDTGVYRCVVINSGGAVFSAAASLSLRATGPADLDHDCDVDLDDFVLLTACMTGPAGIGPPPGCDKVSFDAADSDGDGDVDQVDFGLFQRCYSGPDRDPEEACRN